MPSFCKRANLYVTSKNGNSCRVPSPVFSSASRHTPRTRRQTAYEHRSFQPTITVHRAGGTSRSYFHTIPRNYFYFDTVLQRVHDIIPVLRFCKSKRVRTGRLKVAGVSVRKRTGGGSKTQNIFIVLQMHASAVCISRISDQRAGTCLSTLLRDVIGANFFGAT